MVRPLSLPEQVRDRAQSKCEYCHLPEQWFRLGFHLEHVRPRQHGGKTAFENLAMACSRCNLNKGPNLTGIDPETELITALYDPRASPWTDHFLRVGGVIYGNTPCGRATIATLKMNERERVAARDGMIKAGKLPATDPS